MVGEEDAMAGVKLLGAHVAQVKLAAAENEYAARVRIRELEAQLSDTATRLEEANGDIASFQSQVKQLQSESAHKTLVAEREKWKSLIDTLRDDRAKLRERLEEAGIGAEAGAAAGTGSSFSPRSDHAVAGARLDAATAQSELEVMSIALAEKQGEIDGLRAKLDLELELKWERAQHLQQHQQQAPQQQQQRNGGWQKSLLESFAEVLAPFPSSSPPPSPPPSPLQVRVPPPQRRPKPIAPSPPNPGPGPEASDSKASDPKASETLTVISTQSF